MNINKILEQRNIVSCRIDLGGTLDISTFYLSMNHLLSMTSNDFVLKF